MLRRLVILAVAAAIAAVFLVATNQRMLVWETKVTPGDTYVVEGHGDLGKSKQPSLVCRYFTGVDVITKVIAYQPSAGSTGCPFLAENAA
jgi:hypothetical protein